MKIGKVTSQTTSLITSAVQMGIERNLKILIVDASFRDEMMKKAFLQDESNDELIKKIICIFVLSPIIGGVFTLFLT